MTKLLRLAAVALFAAMASIDTFSVSETALDQRKLNDQPQIEGGELRVLKRTGTTTTTTKPKTTTKKTTTKPKTTTKKSTKSTKSTKSKTKVKVNVKVKGKSSSSGYTAYSSNNKSSGGSTGGAIVFLLIVLIIIGLIVYCKCIKGGTTVIHE